MTGRSGTNKNSASASKVGTLPAAKAKNTTAAKSCTIRIPTANLAWRDALSPRSCNTCITNTVLEKVSANAITAVAVHDRVNKPKATQAANKAIKNACVASMCSKVVPQTWGLSKSLNSSFKPMVNSSKVMPMSESVCKNSPAWASSSCRAKPAAK